MSRRRSSRRRSSDHCRGRVIDSRSANSNAKGRCLYQFGLPLSPTGQSVIPHTAADSVVSRCGSPLRSSRDPVRLKNANDANADSSVIAINTCNRRVNA